MNPSVGITSLNAKAVENNKAHQRMAMATAMKYARFHELQENPIKRANHSLAECVYMHEIAGTPK